MRYPASLPAPRQPALLAFLALVLLPVLAGAAPFLPSLAQGPSLALPAQPAGAEGPSPAATAAGATTDWSSQVCGDLEWQEYAGSETEGGWQAPNQAQNLRARFQRAGVEVVSRAAGAWRWHWETPASGRPSPIRRAVPASTSTTARAS